MSPASLHEDHSAFLPGTVPPTVARRIWSRIFLLGACAAVILFVTAGTFDFWEADAWLIATFVPAAVMAVYLLVRHPEGLPHRLDPHHHSRAQRRLWTLFAPLFVLAFMVPGLDLRFQWSDADVETVPRWLALLADGLVVCGILFAGYALKTVSEVRRARPADAEHALLSTGPYHMIRHPLFAASLVVWLATPVALGSWVALPVFLLVTPYYVLQLRRQERELHSRLPGYAAYCKRTPFRLIPFVW